MDLIVCLCPERASAFVGRPTDSNHLRDIASVPWKASPSPEGATETEGASDPGELLKVPVVPQSAGASKNVNAFPHPRGALDT